jgi:hypothetical protein
MKKCDIWAAAKAAGLKTYCTGKPCRRGHIAFRWVCGRRCSACDAITKARSNFTSYKRRWYDANVERERAKEKRRYAANPAAKAARVKVRQLRKLRAVPPWADHTAIRKIYEQARARARTEGIAYHVDHIIPIRGRNVCGLHVETNLQIVEAAQNLKKAARFTDAAAAA